MFLTPEDCIGEHSPGRLLRSVNHLMRSRVDHNLQPRQCSCQDWLALQLLDEGTARNPSDLARDLGMTTGGVTRLIDSLEDRGWIMRDRSASDRREVRLRLTPEGGKELEQLTTTQVATWKEILAVFSDGEVEEFARLLSLMKHGLQQMSESRLLEDVK